MTDSAELFKHKNLPLHSCKIPTRSMPNSNKSYREIKTLRILYILAVYILLQLTWWGYLLTKANINSIQLDSTIPVEAKEKLIRNTLLMIVGEGSVFVLLLVLGFIYLKRSISKQLQLAKKEQTFLLSVTHELKTPVSSVKLFLETIKSHDLPREQVVQLAGDALKENNRLESMAENILLTTRLDQKVSDLHKEKIDLSEIVSTTAARLQSLSGHIFKLDIKPQQYIIGDAQMLQVMCHNVIENALKYDSPEPHITLKVSEEKNAVTLEISDEGPGIDESEYPRIFEKFYRIGDERTRKHKGTGLGLYLVKNIVQLHNGKIFISPNSPKGTKFKFQFNKTTA